MASLRDRRVHLGSIAGAFAAVALFLASSAEGSISVFYTATGQVNVSADGCGSNTDPCMIRANKPSAGATVRNAFLMSATTPSSTVINNGDITLAGSPVSFTTSVASTIGGHNYLGEVTTIVKPTLDAAAVGITSFPVTEGAKTFSIDGEALVVVWNDPALTQTRSVILLFGTQASAGDTFAITLGNTIDPTSPSSLLDMGLGISFSFQANGSQQFSIIDVNGRRPPAGSCSTCALTTAAGGEDDGASANGALMTVGGIGDSDTNPVNPLATPTNPRSDDELYTLLPFITNTTTTIQVFTQNPSNDDNIFFAYFNISGAAIVGSGIVLTPATATNPVGTSHTVTATVVDATGAPIVGTTVTFTITSGPDSPRTATAVTDASGKATFTYTNNGTAGTDQIQASFVNSNEQTITSNVVEKIWGSATTPVPTVTIPSVTVPTLDMKGFGLLALLLAGAGLVLITGMMKR